MNEHVSNEPTTELEAQFDVIRRMSDADAGEVEQAQLDNNQFLRERVAAEKARKDQLIDEINYRQRKEAEYQDVAASLADLARGNRAALTDARTELRSVMASISQLEIEGIR